jgi:formamidopyrimidine-DNA glycosylase
MPELPEVETTRNGIEPYITGRTISHVIIRNPSLRWPIDSKLSDILTNQTIHSVTRRAKYLLLACDSGTLIIHLGMSGKLRVLNSEALPPHLKHDHVEIEVDNKYTLRYNDPRRFGAVIWTNEPIEQHKLLSHLGPEPLTEEFNADYLWHKLQKRKSTLKTSIMDGKIVVGAGNIYANEALFLAKLHPKTISNTVSIKQCRSLVKIIKEVLERAIKAGGTTLKDFRKSDGQPGYFAQELNVYGRKGLDCVNCGTQIVEYKETQRATFYCPLCQQLET